MLKPSPETVLDSYLFAEAAAAAGLPAGVVNIVPGGREIGAYLVTHPDVDKVAFTGSTAAGRQHRRGVRPAAAPGHARTRRQVRGDHPRRRRPGPGDDRPGPVRRDAGQQRADLLARHPDPGPAVPLRRGRRHVGRLRGLAAGRRRARPGHADRPDGRRAAARPGGAATSPRARARARGWSPAAAARPAWTGAGSSSRRSSPTSTTTSTIAQEEIFGPVLSVIAYDDTTTPIRIANDSDYGLGGVGVDRRSERAPRTSPGGCAPAPSASTRYLPDPAARSAASSPAASAVSSAPAPSPPTRTSRRSTRNAGVAGLSSVSSEL